ncbi:hypothetical protein LHA01_12980 [Schleiferilactobacillus harbinensis]|nr:hypothetical protein LHA01_12980 [Schleiferilactobacillus harbinensis]
MKVSDIESLVLSPKEIHDTIGVWFGELVAWSTADIAMKEALFPFF